MPVHNSDIADILNKVADLLDIKGENEFRVRAYRTAAQNISGMSKNIADMVKEGNNVSDMPGIGSSIADKVKEIVETGNLSQLEELEKKVPPELSKLVQLSDLGPKRVHKLNKELGIESLDDLQKAIKEGKVESVEGFGKKTVKNLKEELKKHKEDDSHERIKFVKAEQIVKPLLEYLQKAKGVHEIDVTGSFRRRKETVGDLDILVTCEDGEKIMNRFVDFEDVTKVISKGETRSSVILKDNVQVDLRAVSKESYGAALVYFTGSKAHNIEIRKMSNKRKLKINEYGVFKNDKRIAGKTEKEVYEQIDLPYIQPELRENRGEIVAAQKNKLPELVELDDIKGDLQSHTKATDGKYSLEEMAMAAQDYGHEYFAVTDHSKRVTMAKGLDEKRLEKQIKEIDKVNKKLKGKFRILSSVEVDILEDGSLDLDDDILKTLDVVVCSVHYNLNLSREKQTKRVLKAFENPHVNILAHPTGRIIQKRQSIDIDLEKIVKAAKENGLFLELNAQPDRLDLSDVYCKMAKEQGVKIAISTDAHMKTAFNNMKYGVYQARRGWLTKEDVINTRSWNELKKLLKR